MPNETLSREDVTAHKHKLAAERAATIAALPAERGPVVEPTDGPFISRPFAKPVAEPVKPVGVPAVKAGLSADCLAADAKYNDSVAAWYSASEKHEASATHRYDMPETVTVADLAKRKEAIQGSELSLAQKAVSLVRDYCDRSAARSAELKVYAESCVEEMQATEEKVVKALNAAGVSVESQPAYPANCEAATITFDHQVRGSADWRAASLKLSEAQSAHTAEVSAVTAGRTQLANAEGYLASVVRRLAGC